MTPQEILSAHKLNYNDLKKSTVSYLSEVWLTEKYAVKIYGRNKSGFLKERWFYERACAPYAPAMIDYGEDYIIMERIYGTSIYRTWHKLTDAKRESYAMQIAEIALDLTSRGLDGTGDIFAVPENWQNHISGKILDLCAELDGAGKIPHILADRVRDFANENADCLAPCDYGLCYSDLHFDNLLADSNGKVWLLDYETLCAAPRDYILDMFDRMSKNPFVPQSDNKQSGMALTKMLEKFAPALFSYPDTHKRVAMYSLLYELDLLRYYPNDKLALGSVEECMIL